MRVTDRQTDRRKDTGRWLAPTSSAQRGAIMNRVEMSLGANGTSVASLALAEHNMELCSM